MKKSTILIAAFTILLAGCNMQPEKTKVKNECGKCEMNQSTKADIKKYKHEHKHKNDIKNIKQIEQEEVIDYAMQEEKISKQASDQIKSKYDFVNSVDISAWSKGIEAQIQGNKNLNKDDFEDLGKFSANAIRKSRGVPGAVHIYYNVGKKTTKGIF